MEDLNLPPRLIAAGQKPFGHRVNIYQKMSIIEQIRGYLNKEELDYILRSPLDRLFEYPNKPAWSGGFGLFLLSRQLEIAKENEIWILFAGKPIRFSLREFKIVTGLACGKYPKEEKKKRKTNVKKKEEFYGKLFGREENVKVERVLSLLQSADEADRDNRLRYACLALVDGILLPTTHYPKAKIVKEHVEMVENLEKFLQFPWGRKSFDRMMTTIKERDLAQLATADVAVQGLFIALQVVVFEAVPAILGENSSVDEERNEYFVEQQPRQFKLSHVRELDESSDVEVESIIRPEVEFDSDEEDLSWSDDEEDPRVDKLVSLISEGFKFDREMFTGGRKPAELVGITTTKRPTTEKTVKGRKVNKQGKVPVRGTMPNIDEPGTKEVVSHSMVDRRIQEALKGFEEKIGSIVASKLEDNNKTIIVGMTKWLADNKIVYEAAEDLGNSSDATQSNTGGKGGGMSDTSPNRMRGFGNEVADSSPGNRANESVAKVNTVNSNVRQERVTVPEFNGPDDDVRNDSGMLEAFVGGVAAHYNSEEFTRNVEVGSPLVGPEKRRDEMSENVINNLGDKGVDASDALIQKDTFDQVIMENEVNRKSVNNDAANGVMEGLPAVEAGKEIDGNVNEGGGMSDGPPLLAGADELGEKVPGVTQEGFQVGREGQSMDGMSLTERRGVSKEDGAGKDVGRVAVLTNVGTQASQAPPEIRKSKRLKTTSSRIDDRFDCGKRLKTITGQQTTEEMAEVNSMERRFHSALEALSVRSVSAGGNLLSLKDINFLLERAGTPNGKIVDAFCQLSRRMLRVDERDGKKLRVEVLGSKFVAHLTRQYTKFSKTIIPEAFAFSDTVKEIMIGDRDTDRAQLFEEADVLYLPLNFNKIHWVALAVHLFRTTIEVLDCDVNSLSESTITENIQPLATMLPYLFRQVASNPYMKGVRLTPFSIERPAGLPQIAKAADSGIMSILFIQAHAIGGVEECRLVEPHLLPKELKKLVTCLVENF